MSLDVYCGCPVSRSGRRRAWLSASAVTGQSSRSAARNGMRSTRVESQCWSTLRPMSAKSIGANITHNLNRMAEAVDLYLPLWRPEEIGIAQAEEIVDKRNEEQEKSDDR